MEVFKIGEIADKAGVSQRTIRYYEEIGLISHASRTQGSFRLYTEDAVKKIKFIQSLKDIGLSLEDIKTILKIRKENKTGKEAAKKVHDTILSILENIKERLKNLTHTEEELKTTQGLIAECMECKLRPTANNCLKCPVVTERADIPEPFKTILELEK